MISLPDICGVLQDYEIFISSDSISGGFGTEPGHGLPRGGSQQQQQRSGEFRLGRRQPF